MTGTRLSVGPQQTIGCEYQHPPRKHLHQYLLMPVAKVDYVHELEVGEIRGQIPLGPQHPLGVPSVELGPNDHRIMQNTIRTREVRTLWEQQSPLKKLNLPPISLYRIAIPVSTAFAP